MTSLIKIFLLLVIASVVWVVISTSVMEKIDSEFGSLWLDAAQDLFDNIKHFVTSFADLSTLCTFVGIIISGYLLYQLWILLFSPMNRVRLQHEVSGTQYCVKYQSEET